MSEIEKLQIELLKLEVEHKKLLNYIELRQKFSEAYMTYSPRINAGVSSINKSSLLL